MKYTHRSGLNFFSDLIAKAGLKVGILRGTHYLVQCFGADGALKWTDEFDNLVVMAGLTDSLDKHLKGSGYTAAWYVGLAGATPVFAEGDTLATHGGWTEILAYSGTNRQTLTLGTVVSGSVDNSASKAVFAITGTATVGGAHVSATQPKATTTGVLYGGGAFTGGNRSVLAGDTLNVTVTLTAAAS